MKNKKVLISIITIIIAIIIGLIIFLPRDNSDNSKFNNDYNVKVPKGTEIIYLTDETITKSLSTNDKLVFLGNQSSEETKTAVKTLLKVAEDNGIDKIYYYDTEGIDKKDAIVKELTKKLNKKEIISPTLFLIKNNKAEEIEEGISKNIEEKYEDIMIAYIMCNTPNC